MTSKERVLCALRRERPDRTPFVELSVDHEIGERILDRSDFSQIDMATELRLDALKATAYPRIYVSRNNGSDGRSYVTGGLLHSRSDLSMIELSDPNDPAAYDEVRRLVDANNGERAVFAATNIGTDPLLLGMGLDGFSYALADDPGLVEDILDRYTDWEAETTRRLCETGVDIIWYTDDIAFNTGPMINPEWFRETALPYLRKVRDACTLPAIFHSDGNLMPLIEDLLSLDFCALHPIEPGAMDIFALKQEYGERICLIGNIDLRYTLVFGTPQEVREEVRDHIERLGADGGYIVSSANSITGYCKIENVLAMRDAILEFG